MKPGWRYSAQQAAPKLENRTAIKMPRNDKVAIACEVLCFAGKVRCGVGGGEHKKADQLPILTVNEGAVLLVWCFLAPLFAPCSVCVSVLDC